LLRHADRDSERERLALITALDSLTDSDHCWLCDFDLLADRLRLRERLMDSDWLADCDALRLPDFSTFDCERERLMLCDLLCD